MLAATGCWRRRLLWINFRVWSTENWSRKLKSKGTLWVVRDRLPDGVGFRSSEHPTHRSPFGILHVVVFFCFWVKHKQLYLIIWQYLVDEWFIIILGSRHGSHTSRREEGLLFRRAVLGTLPWASGGVSKNCSYSSIFQRYAYHEGRKGRLEFG